jgi:hypothetical protein
MQRGRVLGRGPLRARFGAAAVARIARRALGRHAAQEGEHPIEQVAARHGAPPGRHAAGSGGVGRRRRVLRLRRRAHGRARRGGRRRPRARVAPSRAARGPRGRDGRGVGPPKVGRPRRAGRAREGTHRRGACDPTARDGVEVGSLRSWELLAARRGQCVIFDLTSFEPTQFGGAVTLPVNLAAAGQAIWARASIIGFKPQINTSRDGSPEEPR